MKMDFKYEKNIAHPSTIITYVCVQLLISFEVVGSQS